MAHYITIPINANGVIDPDEQIQNIIPKSMSATFGTEDVFIYSHGWWTSADAALKEYNVATTDFIYSVRKSPARFGRPPVVPFLIRIHWPSMLDDDPNSLLDKAEVLSFYTMEKRADDVGEEGLYSILRLLMDAVSPETNIRFSLFGHSFGCKVVCAALEKLAENGFSLPANVSLNVILLQAAFSTNSLDAGMPYGRVIRTFGPRLRMLISHSDKDDAVGKAFPLAQNLNFFQSLIRTRHPRPASVQRGHPPRQQRPFQRTSESRSHGGARLWAPPPHRRLEARLW
jgi:pimeloyl-ACP methyl ester carboxylesterase